MWLGTLRCATHVTSGGRLLEPLFGSPPQEWRGSYCLSIVRCRTLSSHREREPPCKTPYALRFYNRKPEDCRVILNLVAFDLTSDPHHAVVFAVGVQFNRAV